MGITNEEANAWRKEEKYYVCADTGGEGNARSQGENARHQQERIDRAYSARSSIVFPGISIAGGMLRQLISDYRDQMATKVNEIHRIDEERRRLDTEKQRLNEDKEKLEFRIKEFEALQNQLELESEQLE
jgi:hypothetical protein